MLSPAQITELISEFVFLLLGALVVWLALNQRISFAIGSVSWLILSAALIAWGLFAFARPGHSSGRWQKWNRGLSLVLLGGIMLLVTRVPFPWVGKLIIVAGVILIARGIVGSFLVLRQR